MAHDCRTYDSHLCFYALYTVIFFINGQVYFKEFYVYTNRRNSSARLKIRIPVVSPGEN